MRRQDWPERLNAAISDAHAKPFEWGTFDCWIFCADCILAMTDKDSAEDFRGKYTTEAEAEIILSEYGSVTQMLQKLGYEKMDNKLFARRGDIVTFEWPENGIQKIAGGICAGERIVFASKRGLAEIKLTHCKDAYRVK